MAVAAVATTFTKRALDRGPGRRDPQRRRVSTVYSHLLKSRPPLWLMKRPGWRLIVDVPEERRGKEPGADTDERPPSMLHSATEQWRLLNFYGKRAKGF